MLHIIIPMSPHLINYVVLPPKLLSVLFSISHIEPPFFIIELRKLFVNHKPYYPGSKSKNCFLCKLHRNTLIL